MTRQTAKANPINSIVFITDIEGGEAPPWQDRMILSGESSIMVRCFPEQDGPTAFVLGDGPDVAPDGPASFEGVLTTPSRALKVWTVDKQTLLQSVVPETRTRVRIWLSHPQWPDKVIIGLN
jgi:hypothetical protein